jgi:hypothetical protein
MLTRIGWWRRAPVWVPQEIVDVHEVSIRYFIFLPLRTSCAPITLPGAVRYRLVATSPNAEAELGKAGPKPALLNFEGKRSRLPRSGGRRLCAKREVSLTPKFAATVVNAIPPCQKCRTHRRIPAPGANAKRRDASFLLHPRELHLFLSFRRNPVQFGGPDGGDGPAVMCLIACGLSNPAQPRRLGTGGRRPFVPLRTLRGVSPRHAKYRSDGVDCSGPGRPSEGPPSPVRPFAILSRAVLQGIAIAFPALSPKVRTWCMQAIP